MYIYILYFYKYYICININFRLIVSTIILVYLTYIKYVSISFV